MPVTNREKILGIVFDLDGTLYVAPDFAAAIQCGAVVYMAGVLGITKADAGEVMAATRQRLAEESGTVQTLSAVCTELGGNVRDLHAFFEKNLNPELYLTLDERVVELLQSLKSCCRLFIYTNNNHGLTRRILSHLGFDGLFEQIFAIDDAWQAKPDEQRLKQVINATGIPTGQLLFVGDRYDVDLRLPEQIGCPVFLTQSVDQLMRLKNLTIKEKQR